MIYKNTTGQKIGVFAYTASTGAAKTGDAAQITCYESIGFAAADQLDDANPIELDATNMPGWYVFDLTQAETNGEVLIFAPKSSTSGVVLDQIQVFTEASVAQTGDAYARLGAPVGASVSADVADIEGKVDDLEGRVIGTIAAGTHYPQSGDAYARLGAPAGASVSADIADVPTVSEFEARTLPSADYTVVSDLPSVPSAADNATAAAAAILETPANLLKTDASGRVEVSGTKNTLDSVITAIQGADGDTLKDLSDEIAAIGSGSGSGTGTYTDTVTDGTNPLDGVRVQLSTDSAKANPVYQAYTNALGVFLMYPDPGTYYVWFEKAGYDFSTVNGTGVTVT